MRSYLLGLYEKSMPGTLSWKEKLEAAKAAGKQFAAGFVPELYVQDSNRQFDCAILLERCLDDYRRKYGSARISSCKLYIKPEDNTVYYVINDIEDKLPL